MLKILEMFASREMTGSWLIQETAKHLKTERDQKLERALLIDKVQESNQRSNEHEGQPDEVQQPARTTKQKANARNYGMSYSFCIFMVGSEFILPVFKGNKTNFS